VVCLRPSSLVKSLAVDDALRAGGARLVAAGDEVALSQPAVVRLPGAGTVELGCGGVATSGRIAATAGARLKLVVPPLVDEPWGRRHRRRGTCLEADLAAKAAFLLSAARGGRLSAIS
jgi:hypothetical protein